MAVTTQFFDLLRAEGPAPDLADRMVLYGWLIGDWSMDAVMHGEDDSQHQGKGEVHFGWVLGGRAIQDIWILPGFFHGTTLRVYDPGLDAWHILWSDPLKQYYTRQLGRADGEDILQLGKLDDGTALRWRFTEITPATFRWLGDVSSDDGKTWRLQADFRARRA